MGNYGPCPLPAVKLQERIKIIKAYHGGFSHATNKEVLFAFTYFCSVGLLSFRL